MVEMLLNLVQHYVLRIFKNPNYSQKNIISELVRSVTVVCSLAIGGVSSDSRIAVPEL